MMQASQEKRAEIAVIRGTKLVDGNILGCFAQLICNLLRSFHSRIQRVRYTNEGNLFHTIGVPTNIIPGFLPNCGFVVFRSCIRNYPESFISMRTPSIFGA